MTINLSTILILIVSALAAGAGFFWKRFTSRRPAKAGNASRGKWTKTAGSVLMILGIWVFVVRLLRIATGYERPLTPIWSLHTRVFGISVSNTVLLGWGILAILIVLAALGRFLAVPRMKEIPGGAQTILEMVVTLLNAVGYGFLFPFRAVRTIWKRRAAHKLEAKAAKAQKKAALNSRKPKKRTPLSPAFSALLIIFIWAAIRISLLLFIPKAPHKSIWAMRTLVFGVSVSNTVAMAWAIAGILILLAILGRLLVIPGMRDMRNIRGVRAAVDFTATLIYGISWVILAPGRAAAAFQARRETKRRQQAASVAQESSAGKKAPRQTAFHFIKFITKDPKGRHLVKLFRNGALVVIIWVAVVEILTRLFGSSRGRAFDVALSPNRISVLNVSVSSTVMLSWIVMAGLVILAVLARVFVIPRMKENPGAAQNILELMVDGIERYTRDKTGDLSNNLGAYIFTITALLVGCAIVELFGFRPPTTDITFTFALAIITFVLINFYGINRKGIIGRIRSLGTPYSFVIPIRMISDFAIPVSLACRLFGNMLGGMVVVDLLYNALGNGAVGIPSVLGLFFNVFHPLVQAFIFVTLTLAYISEAVE
ncbi:MAG: F0F1 ATP synthase subunit A [Oscillospiraceae bacterium]|nr:F0F1 ATP synthase subunit A [Oscillospiraceae bacterium]